MSDSYTGDFQKRCLKFSGLMLRLVEKLPKRRTLRIVTDQLFRSGTSVGANVYEAKSAESRADFIHKMQIALKEARETGYWLALLEIAELSDLSLPSLIQECNELTAILVASIRTARQNAEQKGQRIGI